MTIEMAVVVAENVKGSDGGSGMVEVVVAACREGSEWDVQESWGWRELCCS